MFLTKPFFPAEEGLCGVTYHVGRFFLQDSCGEKVAHTFHSVLLAANLAAASG